MKMNSSEYTEQKENFRVFSTDHGDFHLTRVYPYGLWKITAAKGSAPKELANQSFTSAEQGVSFIKNYVHTQTLLKAPVKKPAEKNEVKTRVVKKKLLSQEGHREVQ